MKPTWKVEINVRGLIFTREHYKEEWARRSFAAVNIDDTVLQVELIQIADNGTETIHETKN